jgi:hypothetical protein
MRASSIECARRPRHLIWASPDNMPKFVAAALALVAAVSAPRAYAQNSEARASFPIMAESESAHIEARPSPLATLSPQVSAALPDLAPRAPPAQAPPPRSKLPPAPNAAALPPPNAPPPSYAFSQTNRSPALDRTPAPRHDWRKDWMLSLEGVTHAPIDAGFQAGLETPIGLRLFAGYGWVPSAYLGVWSGVASSLSSDARAQALFQSGFDSGTSWRIAAGLRPFHNLGLYLDVGYSALDIRGSVAASDLSGSAGLGAVPGDYQVRSSLHMWLAELGYQGIIADRVVLAMGVGVMGTLSAHTTVTAEGGAPKDPALADVASKVDSALESHGVTPTLTVRLGFDMI